MPPWQMKLDLVLRNIVKILRIVKNNQLGLHMSTVFTLASQETKIKNQITCYGSRVVACLNYTYRRLFF